MPPDFIYDLPPVLIFATVLATVGVAALFLHLVFMLQPMMRVAKSFTEVTPSVLAIAGTVFGLSVTFLANAV